MVFRASTSAILASGEITTKLHTPYLKPNTPTLNPNPSCGNPKKSISYVKPNPPNLNPNKPSENPNKSSSYVKLYPPTLNPNPSYVKPNPKYVNPNQPYVNLKSPHVNPKRTRNTNHDDGISASGYRAGQFNPQELHETEYAKYYQSFVNKISMARAEIPPVNRVPVPSESPKPKVIVTPRHCLSGYQLPPDSNGKPDYVKYYQSFKVNEHIKRATERVTHNAKSIIKEEETVKNTNKS